ncbi:MAG TPA: flagellar hook-basal body complex protein [Brevundimonas sp.]|uniref:flagellar hook-basal body complex protein n=1 Tax=Brevundimonas sp. TaxID=1871086 RepID=UPI002C60AFEE|nr:flagellar hook-basal body complex protein [Brevundimonas sp.]HRH19353.1 flagellar hook-basal body complex protein [Brevundimonas sp.]
MSINSAMLAGVSGLKANSAALAALSDNIANVNTVGYKRSQVDFQTMVTGGSAGGYSAGGVLAHARHYVTQEGLLQRTGSSTDLGISGQGFFVTTEQAEDLTASDSRLFTRAGSFSVDTLGYLKNSAGLFLQGWIANTEGEITVDPSDLTRLNSINVGAVGGAAEPTTRVSLNANLMSSQAVSLEFASYDALTNSMAMYDPETGTGVRPDFEMQIPVSDSKGGKRTLAISFLKTDVPNQWLAEIRAVPASDIVTGSGLANGQIRTGLVAFTQDGRLDVDAMQALGAQALFPDPENAILTFGASDDAAPGAGLVNWAPGLGVDEQQVSFDLDTAAGGLTQYDSQSVVQAVITNGTAFGNLTNIEINEEGYVTAIFDNGVTRRIAQVAIATFPSPDNLIAVNGNAFRVSQGSGTYNLKAPGTGGAGMIAPNQLEASTVDLSAEFTGLITTQRAYSASSKIITTADEMLEELIRVKR